MFKKILIPIFIVLVLLIVFRDFMIKQAIESVGSSVLGAPVKVGGFSLSLLTSHVKITDFKIYNPSGFISKPMIDIAHIEVQYHPLALASGKLYFSLIDIDVHELAIEKNKRNEYNVNSLKIKPQESSSQSKPLENSQQVQKPLEMNIEVLKLNVDQVTLREEAAGGIIKETNHGVGLHKKIFTNITRPEQLIALVLFEASGLGALKDIGMAATKEMLSNAKEIASEAKNTATKVSGDAKKAVSEVSGEAKKTVQSLLGTLKSVVNK